MYSIKWRLNNHRTHVEEFNNLKEALNTWQVLKAEHPNCVFTLVKKGKKI